MALARRPVFRHPVFWKRRLWTEAPARRTPIDRPRFEAVLLAARGYAEERSFIFYCMRQDAEARTFPLLRHARGHHRHAGESARGRQRPAAERRAGRSLATVRVAQPDAKDSALDARCAATCAATNVMQEINLLQGIGSPLFRRPAVRTLNPP